METDKIMFNLRESLNALIDSSKEDSNRNVPGVYLLLRDKTQIRNKDFSMSVRYLTTAGAALNGYLNNFDKLSAPSGFDSSLTKVLGAPIQGTDEIDSNSSASTMLRYYILTNDRIVTPSDIKLFCYKELATRYGLSEDMISRIRITRRQTLGHRDCGYEILIEIAITANQFVKKYFANSIPTAEIMLQKMIEVRSSGIYPISVSIDIEDK